MTEEDGGTGGETASDGTPKELEYRFEQQDATDLDADRVVAELSADEPTADPTGTERRAIREIDKRSYCHQCDHFAEPPAFGCTNDGTEILELTGLETVRVADCPVVLEDERIEEGD